MDAKLKVEQQSKLYLAPLDGLRFLAFLAVFIHHQPILQGAYLPMKLQRYGWVGVELFFVISSFLFFHLLDAERIKTGAINIRNFFIRRFLRIYPLMILFPVLMLLIYGSRDGLGGWRIAGLALMLDNFISWFKGYNSSVPLSAHLWTLSFEFQIYLLIPFAFMLRHRIGTPRFLAVLALIATFCFLARLVVFSLGAPHPVIWVTPFLRPDTVLLGMALSVVRPTWRWQWSAVVAAVAGALFLSLPLPWETSLSSAVMYPLAGVMCAAIVDAGLRAPWLAALLSLAPMRTLGKISFGLYVFHILGKYLALQLTPDWLGRPLAAETSWGDYLALLTTALVITILVSMASYWGMERWFDRLRHRFSAVTGRPS